MMNQYYFLYYMQDKKTDPYMIVTCNELLNTDVLPLLPALPSITLICATKDDRLLDPIVDSLHECMPIEEIVEIAHQKGGTGVRVFTHKEGQMLNQVIRDCTEEWEFEDRLDISKSTKGYKRVTEIIGTI